MWRLGRAGDGWGGGERPLADINGHGHPSIMSLQPPIAQHQNQGEHAVFTLLVANGLLMGLTVAAFVEGPYSSPEQELWYRYGSIGLFVAGAVLPAVILRVMRRSKPRILLLIIWMAGVFVIYLWYMAMSGGGV